MSCAPNYNHTGVLGTESLDGILGASETIVTFPARNLGSQEENYKIVRFPGRVICQAPDPELYMHHVT